MAAVSNASGQVIEQMAYDPWGKRRNVNGLGDPLDELWAQTTDRGYTQHEHLDEVGVIHMNGRIYDPLIGRFMSADPFIQAIDNLQSHNRYAYVINNPLAYTDPNGYFFKKLLRAVVAIAVAVYAPQMIFSAWANAAAASAVAAGTTLTAAQVTTMYIGSGAMAGALSGGIGSGSSKGALQGALTGGLFAAAGLTGTGVTAAERASSASRYVAHAAAGCVSAVAGGGQCGQGAASSVFGKYTTNAISGWGGKDIQGVIARGVATSVAGGVGSVIAGGKFANGAETAAYGYLFNQILSNEEAMRRANQRNRTVMSGACVAEHTDRCSGLSPNSGKSLSQKATDIQDVAAGITAIGLRSGPASPVLLTMGSGLGAAGVALEFYSTPGRSATQYNFASSMALTVTPGPSRLMGGLSVGNSIFQKIAPINDPIHVAE